LLSPNDIILAKGGKTYETVDEIKFAKKQEDRTIINELKRIYSFIDVGTVDSLNKGHGSPGLYLKNNHIEAGCNYSSFRSDFTECEFTGSFYSSSIRANKAIPSTGFGAGSSVYMTNSGKRDQYNKQITDLHYTKRVSSVGASGIVIICPVAEREINNLGECCVCLRNIHQLYAMIPCGHTSVCGLCIGNIENVCPICRTSITSNMKIFK